MVVKHPGIKDRHDDTVRTLTLVPCVDGIDRRLLGGIQVPLAAKQRVVGIGGVRISTAIQRHVFDLRIRPQSLEDLLWAGTSQLDMAGQHGFGDLSPSRMIDARALGQSRGAIRAVESLKAPDSLVVAA